MNPAPSLYSFYTFGDIHSKKNNEMNLTRVQDLSLTPPLWIFKDGVLTNITKVRG